METCDRGHRFIKLPDHPKKDGKDRCPYCLAEGFDILNKIAASDYDPTEDDD